MRHERPVAQPKSAPAGPQHSRATPAGSHNERSSQAAQVARRIGQQKARLQLELKSKEKRRRREGEGNILSKTTRRKFAETSDGRQSSGSADRQRPASVRMSPAAHTADSSSGLQMGAGRVADHFTQVPHQSSQTPHSFSGPLSRTSNLAGSSGLAPAQPAPFFHQHQQTMPADLSLATAPPIAQQAAGPASAKPATGQFNLVPVSAFEQSATHNPLGKLMAVAAARQQQQQQELLSRFSNLHSLSAVASAMQHQHHQNQSKPQEFSLGAFATQSHLGAVSQHQFQSMSEAAPRKPAGRRRRGSRKCRKVYGMAQRPLWCTQCKWKKACSRFAAASGNANGQQADQVSTTSSSFARRLPGPKTRAPPIDYQLAAAAAAAANGSHLIRNLLGMSASFQRLQTAVTQPNFRSNAHL